jgi:hypothetical protein
VPQGSPPDDESSPEEDLASLRAFVIQLRELLQAVVDDGRFVPNKQHDDVRAAWQHARADLDALVSALTRPQANTHLAGLGRHGLTGVPLRMKLRAWRSRFFRFGRRMNRAWLRSVLRWGDTILGSLTDVIPFGAAGKEFKEAIENFLDDAENG